MSRKVGRPRLDADQPSRGVWLTLPLRTFDAYVTRALHEGVSVPEILRRDLYHAQTRPEYKSFNPAVPPGGPTLTGPVTQSEEPPVELVQPIPADREVLNHADRRTRGKNAR